MARPLRLEFADALYHITSRENERNAIYFDDTDFELFLMQLGKVCERYAFFGLHYSRVSKVVAKVK